MRELYIDLRERNGGQGNAEAKIKSRSLCLFPYPVSDQAVHS